MTPSNANGIPSSLPLFIGTAGWALPKALGTYFSSEGTHLEKYSHVFRGVELNSSFYRLHLPKTYARWAASVPDSFRFSVKMLREITHRRRLVNVAEPLTEFLAGVRELGEKLGVMLVQLPPSLAFDETTVLEFFGRLRDVYAGNLVCEPRHATWFDERATALLRREAVARVAADPALVPAAAEPGAATSCAYYRLHGSPRMYYSAYSETFLARIVTALLEHARARPTWCIFDNTAEGAALPNAFTLLEELRASRVAAA